MWHARDYTSSPSLGAAAPNRLAARLAYQQAFPHYPLVAGKGDVALYQVPALFLSFLLHVLFKTVLILMFVINFSFGLSYSRSGLYGWHRAFPLARPVL
jgi:hypothetical protein